jgi:zinc protease
LDDDPYTDVLWGILTGYDAAGALTIAQTSEPLAARRVVAGTQIALDRCQEGIWYCELEKHRMVRKEDGAAAKQEEGPADTTKALVDGLNEYRADLFVTSGHATERDWQIGFRYRNGSFRSEAGKLFGVDTRGERFPIVSPNPKVYLPVGNCLMGHIDGPDAMALAFMNSCGVRQMIGYTVPTWFGYAGWGCLDYFVEQPGRYTFAEAFFANHQALLHRLETEFPKLAKTPAKAGQTNGSGAGRGLLFDRDVLAFYGDPAWQARMAPGPLQWDQKLAIADNVYTFVLEPRAGEETFEPVDTNGSQRGFRPIFCMLPHRVRNVTILEGQDLKPVVTDNFLLIPNPRSFEANQKYRVVFRGAPIERP